MTTRETDLDIDLESGGFAAYGAVWTEACRRAHGEIHLALHPAAGDPRLADPRQGDIARDGTGRLWRYERRHPGRACRWRPAVDDALAPLARADGPHPAAPALPLVLLIRAG